MGRLRGLLVVTACLGGANLKCSPAEGQESIKSALVSTWKSEQGLPENSVECLLQTRAGWLWIGTRDGLARFDGIKFTIFNGQTPGFTSDAIIDLAEDNDGAVWIATKRGAYRFCENRFEKFQSGDGLLDDHIYGVFPARGGGVWIGTKAGLNRLKEGVSQSFPFKARLQASATPALEFFDDSQIFCVRETQGGVLIGTSDGVWRLNPGNGKFEPVWHAHAGHLADRGNSVRAIEPDPEGGVWFGTDTTIVRWNGKELARWDTEEVESDSRLRRILVENPGQTWIVRAGGVFRIVEGRMQEFDSSKELADMYATDLVRDQEGNLWLATRYGGLRRFRWPRVQTLTTKNGLPSNNVYSVAEEENGALLLGTGNGACEYSRGEFKALFSSSVLSRRAYRTVLRDSFGNYWLGDTGGGVRWIAPYGQPQDSFRSLPTFADFPAKVFYQDRQTNIWMGTSGAILRFVPKPGMVAGNLDGDPVQSVFGEHWRYRADRNECFVLSNNWIYWPTNGGTWRGTINGEAIWRRPGELRAMDLEYLNARNPLGPLASYDVRAIQQDQEGTIWFGTQGGGLGQLREKRFNSFTTTNGLADNDVWAIHENAAGTLWLGTRAGLSRMRDGAFFNFTRAHGLPEMIVHQILEDDRGHLWLGGSRGIFRVAWKDLELVADGKGTSVEGLLLNESDGMLNTDTNGGGQPSACASRDGNLWFATSQGLVLIDPRRVVKSTNTPPVFIEALYANGRLVPEANKTQSLSAGSGNRVEIQYTALCFSAPEKVRFQFRLEGLDKQWVEAGTRRAAYYTNLKPSAYRFRVRACNSDGVWNEAGASVAFVIAPYFYQTSWFYALVGGIALASAFAVHLWRLRRLEGLLALRSQLSVEKERVRIARDLHDGLGAGISQIELLTDNAKHELAPQNRTSMWLEQIAAANERVKQAMSDVQWSANPSFDTVRSLVIRLREDARTYLEPAGVGIHFELPEKNLDEWMSSTARHHLLMTSREVLHNVVQHSGASRVEMRGRCARGIFHLAIGDNGRGFDVDACSSLGRGLENMRIRCEELGAELTIRSAPGATRIEIAAPVGAAVARQKESI